MRAAAARMAADYEQVIRPVLQYVLPLRSSIEQVVRIARQREDLENSVLRNTHGLLETVDAASMPAASAAASIVAAQLRSMDQLTVASARYAEYAATARWAEDALGYGAVTNWRLALEADARIADFARSALTSTVPPLLNSYLADLRRIGRTHAALTDWVVQHDATARLIGDISGQTLASWREYLNSADPTPTINAARMATLSGQAGLGIVSADFLLSAADDPAVLDQGIDRIDADILAPWERSRLEAGRDLHRRLGSLDPTVPEMLAGAWHELEHNGPAGAEKAAHCITEALDRTLRAAAPDEQVRQWHADSGRPKKEWCGKDPLKDHPPHNMRVTFLAQRLGDAHEIAAVEYESLTRLRTAVRDKLQAVKHASNGDLALVRSLLLATEHLLMLLVN